MANEIVRPSALPVRTNPVPSEVVPSDNQVSVGGVSWEDGVNSAVPPASQAEAEAGVINSKRMTPLTTKQAIDAQVPSKISTAINSLNLGTMSQEIATDYTPTAGLAAVALSNEYGDLDNLPTLGTAAATDAADYATAAQGSKADTAVQPTDLGSLALKDSVDVSDVDAVGTPGTTTYLRGDGAWAVVAGGDGVIAEVNPGDDLLDALTTSQWVHIVGAHTLNTPINLEKPSLRITCGPDASITFTGSAGANSLIEFTGVQNLSVDGPLTVDCDGKVSAGIFVRAADGAELVKIDGVIVIDPFASGEATYEACGVFVQCNSGRGNILKITNCRVENVSRSVVGGTCCGITANDFKVITITDNIVDGVYKGSGTVDADGIKAFSQLTSGDYEDALVTIERNTIINCEGRFVKTQTRGKTSIRNNIFRIDDEIDLQVSHNAVDCQIDGATVEDNFFDFRAAWTGGASLILCYMRVPATNPTYTGQQIFGAVRNNKVIVAAAAPDISRFAYIDLDGISSRAYTVGIDVEGNYATTTSGWGAASIGVFAGTINVPVSWAVGATANIAVRDNRLDTSNWFEGLRASGGMAAHGGLGDLTGKLTLEFTNNVCPRATDVQVVPYTSNQCFTSTFRVHSNSIGVRCNAWQPPFNFAHVLGGNEFYLPGTTTPAHSNNPSSFTTSIVSRKGLHLMVDMYGGIKTNRTISITNIGATPSWT